jgi:Leucine-rich repeat (LRR) protein
MCTITHNTSTIAHALNDASATNTNALPRRLRKRNTLVLQQGGRRLGKGKGSSSSSYKAALLPKSPKCGKSSSSRSRHHAYSGKSKGSFYSHKSSKGSSSYDDCSEDQTTLSPTATTTSSPTTLLTTAESVSPSIATVPTPSPTRYCASVQGREEDIATMTSSVVGSGNIVPGTPEGDALNWILNIDNTNTCNDGGIALLERFVLALFFYKTGGESWLNSNGWLSLSNQCTWFGIDCGTDGRVDTISLNQNNLSGEIPDALSNLEQLSVLKLFDNALEGTVPTSLYQLSNLAFLDMEANNLSGKKDERGILLAYIFYSLLESKCTHDDTFLHFTGNLFDAAVFNATSLVRFRASFNQFAGTTIPSDIGRLTSLQQLWIADCGLVGSIPVEINQLVELNDFFAYNNSLTGAIPDDLSMLRNLRRLDLSHNDLTGTLPASMGLLLSLEKIVLSGNSLTGSMPSTIGNLQLMTDLLLDHNSMSQSLPHDFDFLVSLQSLNLEDNAFTGRLPDYTSWEDLRFININNNRFNGTILPSLFAKQGLEYVYFANNTLTGSIPTNYGNASSLIDLWINGNQLTGTIPSVSSSDFPSITEILLNDNALSGDVPDSLCDKRNSTLVDEYLEDFGTLHADCLPPFGSDVPNNPCPIGCCTNCFVGK